MKITDVPFAVLRFQYQLARVPLQLIEDRVVARMGTESPARLLYERSMGRLDVAVGTALGAPDVERRGAALIERSEALGRVAVLDTAADRAVKEATADVKEASDAAAIVREEAGAEKQEEFVAARADAAHQKVAAIREADERVDAAKKQADNAAAKRKDAADAARRTEERKIRTAEESAEAVADAKAEDAEKKRNDAAAKRAEAERVEQLAEANKEPDKGDD
jgi:hypothetical protein